MDLLENEVELVTELCKRIQRAKEKMPAKTGVKILDMGCGTGKLALYVREETGYEVIGIDPVRADVEKARIKTSSVTFEVQSAEEMTFANNTFDFVASLKALHEIPHPQRALKESHRVLKAGGKLFIIDWIGGVPPTSSHAHAKKYFTPEQLSEALSEAGFANVRITVAHAGALMLGEGEKIGR